MSNNIEIEAKVLITKEQYELLIRKLSDRHFEHFVQTNYYIDSETGTLHNFGFVMRIRKKDIYTLTLKTPLAEGLLEKNQVISKEDYSALASKKAFPEGEIKRFLELLGIDVSTLLIRTSLTTDRIELDYADGVLCLDKSTYNNQIDYEIELEETSMENAKNTIIELCEKMGIKDYSFNSISKYARAMASVKQKGE